MQPDSIVYNVEPERLLDFGDVWPSPQVLRAISVPFC